MKVWRLSVFKRKNVYNKQQCGIWNKSPTKDIIITTSKQQPPPGGKPWDISERN
jgi:hypothetical protein